MRLVYKRVKSATCSSLLEEVYIPHLENGTCLFAADVPVQNKPTNDDHTVHEKILANSKWLCSLEFLLNHHMYKYLHCRNITLCGYINTWIFQYVYFLLLPISKNIKSHNHDHECDIISNNANLCQNCQISKNKIYCYNYYNSYN